MKLNCPKDTVMEQKDGDPVTYSHWLQSVDEGVSGCGRWSFWMLSWQTTFWEYLSQNVVAACCLLYVHSHQVFTATVRFTTFSSKWRMAFITGEHSLRMFIKKVLLSHSLITCYCLNPLPHVSGITRVTVETFNLSSIHRLITSHTHTDPGTTGTQAVLDTYCNI